MGLLFHLECEWRRREGGEQRRGSPRRSSSAPTFWVSWLMRWTSCCFTEADRGAVACGEAESITPVGETGAAAMRRGPRQNQEAAAAAGGGCSSRRLRLWAAAPEEGGGSSSRKATATGGLQR